MDVTSKDKNNTILIFLILTYMACVCLYAFYFRYDFVAFFLHLLIPIVFILLVVYVLNSVRASKINTNKEEVSSMAQEKEVLRAALEKTEKKWDNLTNVLSVTMLTINDKGIVTDLVNNLFVNHLSEGDNIYEVFPSENLPEMRKAISKTFSHSMTTRFVLKTIKSIDNNTVWYDAIVAPIKSYDEVVAADIIFIDSTKHKNAQSEKEMLIMQLEKQKKELEQFSLSITHDLKSPLITISGFVGMLRKDLKRGNQPLIEKDLFHIVNATNRMQSLLDDLVKISQIGKLEYNFMPTSMEDIANDAIHLVSGRIKENNVNVRILPGLPILRIDRRRITEVFQNLIDNAIKYMGKQPNPLVEIGAKKKCGETIIYVKDNGMGIDYRHQERIFSLFDKLDHKSEGTGLGLAVAKRIIEKHNGLIWAESEGKGKGSNFCFIIPDR